MFDFDLGTIHLLYKNDPQCCFNYQSVETQFASPVRKKKKTFSFEFLEIFSSLSILKSVISMIQ